MFTFDQFPRLRQVRDISLPFLKIYPSLHTYVTVEPTVVLVGGVSVSLPLSSAGGSPQSTTRTIISYRGLKLMIVTHTMRNIL